MIKKIKEDIYLLNEKDTEACNIFVIKGKRRDLVFDTGITGEAFREIKLNNPLVINSHAHFEHIGGNDLFEKVFIHEKELETILLKDKKKMGFDVLGERKFKIPEMDNPGIIENKDILSIGKKEFIVIETPGHTEGSICLYEPKSRILLTGDTYYEGVSYFLKGSNYDDFIKSYEKLKTLEVELVLTGHNEVLYKLPEIEEVLKQETLFLR